MKLDRITFTGADNSIHPINLAKIATDFVDNSGQTYVEWGILVSPRTLNGGRNRYPSLEWIDDLKSYAQNHNLKLSLHICGGWVRNLLLGKIEFPESLLDGFQRVQLNFHAEKNPCNPYRFIEMMTILEHMTGKKQWIFQIDGALGNKHFESVYGNTEHENVIDAVPLFDTSSGTGISPKEWPKPKYHESGYAYSPPLPIEWLYHGYAGGLGPDNLQEEIIKINEATKTPEDTDCRVWLDMETKVRSNQDRLFDLKKVRMVLELCDSYVYK